MSWGCGHGPWHHGGPGCGHGYWYGHGPGNWHGYGPGYGYGYAAGYGPGFAWGSRRWRPRAEDLEGYVRDLEEELAAVRAELEHLRGPASPQ
jgi:hypothetical protein